MPRPPDLLNFVAWLFGMWLAVAAVLLALAFTGSSPRFHWTTLVYLSATVLFSLLAWAGMGWDKYKAGRGKRRVSEFALHLFELLGGWPGSLLGQRTFRHKTRKVSYQAVYWTIVCVNLALLAWISYLWWDPPTDSAGVPPAATEPAKE